MKNRLENIASIVVCGLPLVNYLYVVVFWLAASASLGKWVQPSINDPKDFFFGIPATVETILMLLSFSLLPIVIYIGYKRRKIAMQAAAYLGCLISAIILFRMDIMQITTWIGD